MSTAGAVPAISVVVPTAGRGAVAACLSGLREQRLTDFESILVADACVAETIDLVGGEFPEVQLLELPARVGFAAAVNAGAALARGEYLAILNDDAVPDPAWLEELVACAGRHPRAVSIASKIIRQDDPTLIDGAGDCMTFSLKAHRRGLGERDRGQFDAEEEVFAASGTACLWRTEAFRALGGFDESFFAYYEDVDLGFRARLAGYECWYAPRAVALHEGAATTGAWAEFEAFHALRNRWLTIVKDAPARWLAARLPDIFAGEMLLLARAAATGQAPLTFRAYRDVLRQRLRLLEQRRQIQRTASVPYDRLRAHVHGRLPPARIAFARIERPQLRTVTFRVQRRAWHLLPACLRDLLRPLIFPPVPPPPQAGRALGTRHVVHHVISTSPVAARISVLIPTFEAGPVFERLLETISAQQGVPDVELIVVDSGSTDCTIGSAARAGARVFSIAPAEFGHGRTRNYAAERSTGAVLVMLVQDALLLGRHALRDLVHELLADERRAVVSARQIARSDADLYGAFVVFNHHRVLWESNGSRSASARKRAEASVDNVCAAVRREVWEQLRFADVGFAEDLDFGLRARARGWVVQLSERTAVAHSHARGPVYHLRRSAADRLYVAPLTGERASPRTSSMALDKLLAAAATSVQELAGALALAPSETAPLTAHIRHVRRELGSGAPRVAPTGGLAELAALLNGNGSPRAAKRTVADIRHVLLGLLESEPLSAFAAAHRHVSPAEAAGFLAKAHASVLGRVLGDALRIQRNAAVQQRLLAGV